MTLIHEAVAATARRLPERIAIVDHTGREISYGDLLLGVTTLARRVEAETTCGERVAVITRKTPGTVLAMLATLVAGRSYVPIDPAAPPARRNFMIREAACALVLDTSGADSTRVDLASVDVASAESASLDDEAYILFTSGSTGTPKGVVITHRNARAFVRWASLNFPLRPGDQVAVHAPLHFDLPVYDMYVGLAGAATLHLVDERTALFPQGLHRFLTQRAITHLYAVPSAMVALLNRATLPRDGLPALRQLLYAGEEFPPAALAAWMAAVPDASVSNLYGPIETNVITSWAVAAPPPPNERVPLGYPITGVTLALLAEDGTASEHDPMEGEIIVAGDCVTPGYLNRPDLTDRGIIQLTTESGPQRFYRTGDFGRRDGAGLLHLLGRRDGLVKTRGFRVELGEIEAALSSHPDVAEAAVVATPDPELTHRLHAVVLPTRTADLLVADEFAERLIVYCRQHLPGYMVPGRIRVVRDMPRTSTGKIARAEIADLAAGWAGATR